jgi:hypothetical protein
MDSTTRDKIPRPNFATERRKRGLEQLEALKTSHRRVLEVLGMCVPLVMRQANQGDPLAKFVLEELEAAQTARDAENVAASSLLADHEAATTS